MKLRQHGGGTAVTTNSRVHSALVVVDSRVRPTYRVRGDCLTGPIQTADSTTTTSGQLVSLASVEVISFNLSVSVFLTSADVVSLTVGSVVARTVSLNF